MPKPTEKQRVKRHVERITAANKVYDQWAKRYRCDRLQDYYCGDQWPGYTAPTHYGSGYEPYTINLIFPTIEAQQPSLLFYRPQVKIEPKPPYGDDPQSTIAARAKLCEDTVQTFIDDPALHFKKQTLLALRDANFRFGVAEVGYTADWIDNPHAGKPMLKDGSDDELKDEGGNSIVQPDKLPQNEQLFVRRLDPRSFRVSLSGKNILDENDWIGYFEWHYVEDVKRNPKYANTGTLKASGVSKDEPKTGSDDEQEQRRGMVKLWKLWDLRTKTRCVLADGHEKYLLEGEAWTYLPFSILKFYEIPNSFYPLPPVANWIGPQDNINEGREARRAHRRRFNRRYTVKRGGIDDTELEKLETGGDGAYAFRNTDDDPIKPVLDAPLGPDNDKDLLESRDDFQQITGVGGEQRGVGEADTATQANIIDVRSRIRESASRVEVADWLGEICRLMLLTLRDKMQLEFWVKRNADVVAKDPAELARIVGVWQEITASDLGDGALDVTVDITSLSPVSEEQRAQQWDLFWDRVTSNPQYAMVLALSDVVLRKTLKYYGITSEGDVAEIRKVLQQMMMLQVAQSQATAGTGSGQATAQPGQPAGLPAAGGGVQ